MDTDSTCERDPVPFRPTCARMPLQTVTCGRRLRTRPSRQTAPRRHHRWGRIRPPVLDSDYRPPTTCETKDRVDRPEYSGHQPLGQRAGGIEITTRFVPLLHPRGRSAPSPESWYTHSPFAAEIPRHSARGLAYPAARAWSCGAAWWAGAWERRRSV